MTIDIDVDLRSRVIKYITDKGRYVTFNELCTELNMTRIQLTYRGINLTELNNLLGYSRRPPKKYKASTLYTLEEVNRKTIEAILENGQYLSMFDLTRRLRIFSEHVYRGLNIDVPELNRLCGFSKSSPMKKIDDTKLLEDITQFIASSDKYVTQYEICEVFSIKSSYLTKSGIDTVSINRIYGKYPVYSWYESKIREVLIQLNIDEVICQKSFDDCRSDRGRMLKFDFYLPTLKLLLEADGSQHYDETHVFYKDIQVKNDRIKEDYCKTHNIRLVRVRYHLHHVRNNLFMKTILENLYKVLTKAEFERIDVNVKNEYFEAISSEDPSRIVPRD